MRAHVRSLSLLALVAIASAAACGGRETPPPTTAVAARPSASTSASASASASAAPTAIPGLPPPGAPKPIEPATVVTIDTGSKARAIAIVSKKLPIVYVRVVVRAGEASSFLARDGDKSKAGIANLTAQLLKDGGAGPWTGPQLATKVDTLGTELSVDVEPDAVTFGLAVTKDKLAQAFEILSAVVTKPRLDAGEFAKLKARQIDKLRQAAKGSGGWMARVALHRELYGDAHPYGTYDATADSIARVALADVKAFYGKTYVASNMLLVLAGDVDEGEATKLAKATFAKVSSAAPPALAFPAPPAHTGVRFVLATKPDSKQADIYLGRFAIPRKDPRWPDLALAMQTFGGGMSGRLFVDVREKRSLAYSTYGVARELAEGPMPVVAYAGTQTSMVPQSIEGLVENMRWIAGDKPITEDELAIAKQSLETGFVFRLETIGSVASVAIDKDVLGLPGADVYDYVAQYRRALRDATLDAVRAEAKQALTPTDYVVAVAGDPSLARELAKLGEVRVVDPEHDFTTTSTLPKAP